LLELVADRLRAVCDGPGVSIGRLGGDEFAILLPHSDAEEAQALAMTLIGALSAPYRLEADQNVRISASIGVALAPIHGHDAETLLTRADIALYVAKAAGKGVSRVFCAPPWKTRTACSCSTSRSSTSRPARSRRARHWCAGTMRSGAGSLRWSSCPLPSKAA
jgi:predicted signal transduction protein with EAL and GGDEF domain